MSARIRSENFRFLPLTMGELSGYRFLNSVIMGSRKVSNVGLPFPWYMPTMETNPMSSGTTICGLGSSGLLPIPYNRHVIGTACGAFPPSNRLIPSIFKSTHRTVSPHEPRADTSSWEQFFFGSTPLMRSVKSLDIKSGLTAETNLNTRRIWLL